PEIEAYRVRGFVQVLHARTAERLRDGYLGCLLGVAGPTARGVPRREIDDGPGEVPVLLRPRTHDPARSPRLSKGRSPERSGVVDPVCPAQIRGPAGRGGGPPPRERAIPQRAWRGRIDLPSALATHCDADRAASNRGGGQFPQSILRVDRGILPLLRNRRNGARGREADRLGKRVVRLPFPLCGPLPVRVLDPPEGP